ncbi:hypothetical protein BZL54_09790 [Burkholderia ubonensis subsp. mesacidophila]|uniref:Lipoprotein n=1 Tax=Burkholderia ubonensis subsp. mesacidophila TaxID=265293 RepID=A0A2A4FFJ4_9BURK|nr:hypothetical protein BZL54_09790 [Burkholderia ubonensis subsp. mesacidophila]
MKKFLYVAALTAVMALAACSHADDDDVGSTPGNAASASGSVAASDGSAAASDDSASANDTASASPASGASR